MDASNKRVAIVSESVQGTIPTTPAFLLLRDTSTEGGLDQPFGESPERRADRRLAATYKGLNSLAKQITMPFAYDDAFELLLSSILCGAWSTDVLTDGSALKSITLEEKHEGGATDPFFWAAGLIADSMSLRLSNGQPGEVQFDLIGLAETTDTAAKSGATYADPSQNEPITPADVVINSFMGITVPKMMDMTMRIQNNVRRRYQWGSQNAWGTGLGRFRVGIDFNFYFEDLAQYTDIGSGTIGELSLTAGILTGKKYTLDFKNAKVTKPVVSDGGNDRDEMVSCHVDAMWDSGSTSQAIITRAVA